MKNASDVVERLYSLIEDRKGGDPSTSYTASLLEQGSPQIARKVREEALEVVTAALTGENKSIVAESADLFYHLLVLWAQKGISPNEVWTELARREGTSGIKEKASRKK